MMTSNNLTVISYNSESNKHCNMLLIFVMIKISKYLLRGALTLNYMGVLIASPCHSYFQRLQDQTSYLLLYLLGLKDSIGFVANRCYVPPWITGEPYIQSIQFSLSCRPSICPSVTNLYKKSYIFTQIDQKTSIHPPEGLQRPPPPPGQLQHNHDNSTTITTTTTLPLPPPLP